MKPIPTILLLLIASLSGAAAPLNEEKIEWDDVTLDSSPGLLELEQNERIAYYSLKDVYKIERIKSSGHALVYFQGNSLVLRIEFGKQNANEKFDQLVRYFANSND
jgi:hypothetical protein